MRSALQLGVYAGEGLHAYVGADVGDALQIRQQIEETGAYVHAALSLAQALQVQVVQRVHHVVRNLFERLDLHGGVYVALFEGLAGKIEDAVDEIFQNVDLPDGVVGKLQPLGVQILRHLRDVHRVVA